MKCNTIEIFAEPEEKANRKTARFVYTFVMLSKRMLEKRKYAALHMKCCQRFAVRQSFQNTFRRIILEIPVINTHTYTFSLSRLCRFDVMSVHIVAGFCKLCTTEKKNIGSNRTLYNPTMQFSRDEDETNKFE